LIYVKSKLWVNPSLENFITNPEMKEKISGKIKVLPLFTKQDFWKKYYADEVERARKLVEERSKKEEMAQKKLFNDLPEKPYPLPDGFEWHIIDPKTKDLDEAYELLAEEYITDLTERFRMKYPLELLRWIFTPPGYFEDGAFGVRDKSDNSLVAFANIIPSRLNIDGVTLEMVEPSFLCVRPRVRPKRLTPTIMKEGRRKGLLKDFRYSFFSSSKYIAPPCSETWYYHRTLNFKKTLEVSSLLQLRLAWILFQMVAL